MTNPGQFFACCGLLEVAHRLWPGVEGWFEDNAFSIAAPLAKNCLDLLVDRLRSARLCSDYEVADDKTCPLRLQDRNSVAPPTAPLSLRLDWWLDEAGVGSSLKTWAGQQRVTVISRAMLHTAAMDHGIGEKWLDRGLIAKDPDTPGKVVEPFCLDARRFVHSLDTGFSLDVQQASVTAYPATEFFALVGLQRFRPKSTSDRRSFDYWTWSQALSAPVAAGVACGAVPILGRRGYRFSLRFRDDQKRYKAFSFATQIGGDL
ncbi:MAG: hypothetical protein HYU64_09480 [Armatimonadetes bacterium]|nr:hypothetical protein [Armatimonadota bacterium]